MRTTIDILIAAVLLIVLGPLFLALLALIAAASPGNPLYCAPRVGRNGRVFGMWKFRTMTKNAAALGPPITRRNDPRVTSVGRVLRRTKMDELPQLINVLAGEMSLVGPRPETPEIVVHYTKAQRAVLSVKPGITGPAQLKSGHEADSIPENGDVTAYYRRHLMDRKLTADLEYVKNRTLTRDLRILWATAAFVLRSIARQVTRQQEEMNV